MGLSSLRFPSAARRYVATAIGARIASARASGAAIADARHAFWPSDRRARKDSDATTTSHTARPASHHGWMLPRSASSPGQCPPTGDREDTDGSKEQREEQSCRPIPARVGRPQVLLERFQFPVLAPPARPEATLHLGQQGFGVRVIDRKGHQERSRAAPGPRLRQYEQAVRLHHLPARRGQSPEAGEQLQCLGPHRLELEVPHAYEAAARERSPRRLAAQTSRRDPQALVVRHRVRPSPQVDLDTHPAEYPTGPVPKSATITRRRPGIEPGVSSRGDGADGGAAGRQAQPA